MDRRPDQALSRARPSLRKSPATLFPASVHSYVPSLWFSLRQPREPARTRPVKMERSQVSLALLAALLLAFASASIAEARHLHRIDHRRRSAVPGASSFCGRAEFPQLCYFFASKLPTATAKSVIEATVQAAVSGARNAKVLADKLMDSPTTDNGVKGGIDVCRQNFGMLVRDLQKGLDSLNGAGSHLDLMSNLSAALTDIDSCDDTFNETPGLTIRLMRWVDV